jgi:glycosyltransferase involved in cell wall biosynthesis
MKLNRPIRVLHSFGSLGKGGIESWLINILRLRSPDLHFDFLLNELGGAYEAEARSYGCHIYHAPPIRQLGTNLRFVEQVLRDNKYDVYHVHGEEFMGDGVKTAAKAGIQVRIAHSHNTRLARGKKSLEMRLRSWRHKTLDRSRILLHATDILACSIDAGRFLVGQHWEQDARCRTLYCGVPLEQFSAAANKWSRDDFRKTRGIPKDAIVVGHVGSMGATPQKNHLFILEIFSKLAQRDPRYHLFLGGDGPLRPVLEKKVHEMGLQARVTMPGLCDDVPSLMVHGFDVHLLPSLWEGLPVVGLEAVASGLYTVCSDSITKEFTDSFSERVASVSLGADPSEWAGKVVEGVIKRVAVRDGIALIQNGPFSIFGSLGNMLGIYQRRLEGHK